MANALHTDRLLCWQCVKLYNWWCNSIHNASLSSLGCKNYYEIWQRIFSNHPYSCWAAALTPRVIIHINNIYSSRIRKPLPPGSSHGPLNATLSLQVFDVEAAWSPKLLSSFMNPFVGHCKEDTRWVSINESPQLTMHTEGNASRVKVH